MIELLLQAERALSAGLLDPAQRLYEQAVAADPRNSIAVVGLARVALERGDDGEAYRRARAALAIDPENVAATRLARRIEEVYATRGRPVPMGAVQPAVAAGAGNTDVPRADPRATPGLATGTGTSTAGASQPAVLPGAVVPRPLPPPAPGVLPVRSIPGPPPPLGRVAADRLPGPAPTTGPAGVASPGTAPEAATAPLASAPSRATQPSSSSPPARRSALDRLLRRNRS